LHKADLHKAALDKADAQTVVGATRWEKKRKLKIWKTCKAGEEVEVKYLDKAV
jgi:hypothetical protein